MITPYEFEELMAELRREFKTLSFTAKKSAMVWNVVKHYTQPTVAKVFTHMVATFRRAPVVQDFVEAFRAERRADGAVDTAKRALCFRCLDIGVLSIETSSFETMALCTCPVGLSQRWHLPRLDEVEGVTKQTPVPWEAFKPDISINGRTPIEIELAVLRKVYEKVRWWKQTIRNEERAWKAIQEALP